MRKPGAPKKLVQAGSLVSPLLGKIGFDPASFAVFQVWDSLLGAEHVKARAVGLKGGRLLVEVDTSVRLHDMMLRKRQILKKLVGHFGAASPVSDIILQLAPRRTQE